VRKLRSAQRSCIVKDSSDTMPVLSAMRSAMCSKSEQYKHDCIAAVTSNTGGLWPHGFCRLRIALYSAASFHTAAAVAAVAAAAALLATVACCCANCITIMTILLYCGLSKQY
jgi:hypothetical protein